MLLRFQSRRRQGSIVRSRRRLWSCNASISSSGSRRSNVPRAPSNRGPSTTFRCCKGGGIAQTRNFLQQVSNDIQVIAVSCQDLNPLIHGGSWISQQSTTGTVHSQIQVNFCLLRRRGRHGQGFHGVIVLKHQHDLSEPVQSNVSQGPERQRFDGRVVFHGEHHAFKPTAAQIVIIQRQAGQGGISRQQRHQRFKVIVFQLQKAELQSCEGTAERQELRQGSC
mmetsp:Transcript_8695/g.13865  ORF Transcript_8695/g.13865 Transcript_8695/m.13865 type:complete len:223 (-) Transcript_8695:67-735(-)